MDNQIKPYDAQGSKKEQVRDMFNSIALRYDLLNHLLSMGIDRLWRHRLVRMVNRSATDRQVSILDVATGTADLAIALKRGVRNAEVLGVDLSSEMVEVGRQKIARLGLDIPLTVGDAEELAQQHGGGFDFVTASFGVRNFENLERGLGQMATTLKPDGMMYILEFSKPEGWIFPKLFRWYSQNILPRVGGLISKDNRAYSYLPESVEAFPSGEDFLSIMRSVGLKDCSRESQSFGISTIYWGKK